MSYYYYYHTDEDNRATAGAQEVYKELGSPQTKEEKINAGTEAEPVIKRVAQKYNVSEGALKYKLSGRDLLGTPNEESSTIKDEEVKYYITKTGNLTYRAGNTTKPVGSTEVTKETYEQYKKNIEETGRKQAVVDGIYFDIPKSANLPGETGNIKAVERQRLKGQPASKIIREARQEYSKIKQAGYDVNYYDLQKSKAISGITKEQSFNQTTPDNTPPVTGFDVFNMGLEGKKLEYFNTQPGYISQLNQEAQYFLFNNPITNSMAYRNILLMESKVEQARNKLDTEIEIKTNQNYARLDNKGGYNFDLLVLESGKVTYDMAFHPIQTGKGVIDYLLIPPKTIGQIATGTPILRSEFFKLGGEMGLNMRIAPEKTTAQVLTPVLIFEGIGRLTKGKETYIAERLKGEETIRTTYEVDGKPFDVVERRMWIEESKPLSKKPEIQKSYNVKFIETRAGQMNADLKISQLKGYGKATGGNIERVNYDIVKEEYLPDTNINPNVELKPGQTQTVKTQYPVKGYKKVNSKIVDLPKREDIGITESGIIIEGLKSKNKKPIIQEYPIEIVKETEVKPHLRTQTKTITSKVIKGKNTVREKLLIQENKPIQQTYTRAIPVKTIPNRIKGSVEEWKLEEFKADNDFNYLKGKETKGIVTDETPGSQEVTTIKETATKEEEFKPVVGVKTIKGKIKLPFRGTPLKESEIGGSQFSDLTGIYGPKQKPKYTLITPEEQYTAKTPITEQSRGLSLKFAPALKQEIGQPSRILERQEQRQTPIVKLNLEQSQTQQQEQISLQRQELRQEQRQTLRERLVERLRNKPPKTPIVLGKTTQREQQAIKPSYTLFVKSKGLFNRVFTTENKEEAFRKGEVLTDITASASFKVTLDNEALPSPTNNPRYRESKKYKNIFVEKNKYRISTPGEKREITFLGIQANKRRF